MLKAMLPLSTVLGLFVAVPMSDDRTPRTLTGALKDTIETLDVLRSYRSAEAGDVSLDVEVLRGATEVPIADPRARTERLAVLGQDLERLHAHLELLRSGILPANAPLAGTAGPPAVPTVGLAEGELARLIQNTRGPVIETSDSSSTGAPTIAPPPMTNRPTVAPPPAGTQAPPATGPDASDTTDAAAEEASQEAAEFAFNRARAAYFAGQYDRALADFEAGADDARSRYWRARCLEQLLRLPEALELYDAVIADPAAGDLVERAKGDADFLRWKIDFETGSGGR